LNANIKEINDHILAVDFRVIPMIKSIKVTTEETILDISDLGLAFTKNGKILLNTNGQFYEMFKTIFKGFDIYDDKELLEIKGCKEVLCEDKTANILMPYIREFMGLEIERRKTFKKYKASNRSLSKIKDIILTKFINWKG